MQSRKKNVLVRGGANNFVMDVISSGQADSVQKQQALLLSPDSSLNPVQIKTGITPTQTLNPVITTSGTDPQAIPGTSDPIIYDIPMTGIVQPVQTLNGEAQPAPTTATPPFVLPSTVEVVEHVKNNWPLYIAGLLLIAVIFYLYKTGKLK